jgi:hypothetical protein
MLVPFAVVFTSYLFYMEIILNESPITSSMLPPWFDSAVRAWAVQSGIHIAGQLLAFQAVCLGALALWLIFQKKDK